MKKELTIAFIIIIILPLLAVWILYTGMTLRESDNKIKASEQVRENILTPNK